MRMRRLLLCAALAMSCAGGPLEASDPAEVASLSTQQSGTLPNGATWLLDMPARWNGYVILVSHGHQGGPDNPAKNSMGDSLALQRELLRQGYAMLGSSFSRTGWAVEQGVEDQLATLDVFERLHGKARAVIAYGESMGGLVSMGLVERWPTRIAGALPVCASVSGSTPMMNVALDGAFAIKVLLDPSIEIVRQTDEQADRRRQTEALARAAETPQGRARVALAGALAQIPAWTTGPTAPAADDYEAQQRQMQAVFLWSVFPPRTDQEARAGGNSSSNVGVDYAALLERSGRGPMVRALYQRAGLDLAADLARLDAAPRIAADPQAIDYMAHHYIPTGNLESPVLTLHSIGDGVTPPTLTSGLQERVDKAGKAVMLRRLFVAGSGHCDFTRDELATALGVLRARIDSGAWPALDAATLNGVGEGPRGRVRARFTDEVPGVMTRPWSDR